jgi:cell division transport system ATP-binding protein
MVRVDTSGDRAVIEVYHVFKRYGSHPTLYDLNLAVRKNEFLFVTGPSGAGKTTFLKLLFLDERVSEGHIVVNGINLQRIPRKRVPFLRRQIGVVFQDFRLIDHYTVYENISLVLEATGCDRNYIPKRVRQVLRMVGLAHAANAYPPGLSGGEQQRVAVARAAVAKPLILLADEPTGNLDISTAEMVFELFEQLHTMGTTIIVATHDKELLERAEGRVMRLDQGRMEMQSPS